MKPSDIERDEKRFTQLLNTQCLLQGSSLKHLSHYTTQDGFLKIIDSGVLWATQLQYMNDSMEFAIAINLAKNKLEERSKCFDKDACEHRLLQTTKDELNDIANVHGCSVSFSEDPDLLSQWRSYSGSAGVAISFSTYGLTRAASRAGGGLWRCIYEEEDQQIIINQLIN